MQVTEDRCWFCGRNEEELKSFFQEQQELIAKVEFFDSAEIVLLRNLLLEHNYHVYVKEDLHIHLKI